MSRKPSRDYDTQGLLRSLPRPDRGTRDRLETIPGTVPSIMDMPVGCKFMTRCPVAEARCETEEPALRQVRAGRFCRCHLVEPDGEAL